MGVYPKGAFDQVGSFVMRRDGDCEAGATIDDTRDTWLELHVVIRGREP